MYITQESTDLVPLTGVNCSDHTHKTEFWYLLGVLLKNSDDHPHHFYMGVPPFPGYINVIVPDFMALNIKILEIIFWDISRIKKRLITSEMFPFF